MIHKCGCISLYQDAMYGEKMRVHNVSSKGALRCTKCGRVTEPASSKPKQAEE